MTNIEFDGIILQFGFGTKLEKRKFLTENPDKKIYMDLTCFDPQEFYNDFPQLKGSFAALFCDETKKMEIHFQEKNQIVL